MAGKRKRKARSSAAEESDKRQKVAHVADASKNVVKSALLSQFFRQVISLREYLLLKLPRHSKIRRKKIRNVTTDKNPDDANFAKFLDETLVGINTSSPPTTCDRWKQWSSFSQPRVDESASTLANLTGGGKFSQSEIVDFSVWQLFSRTQNTTRTPSHLLCQGFRRAIGHRDDEPQSAIPGISSIYPNSHVTGLKSMPWPRVLTLWGNEGEKAMLDLILDCAIFTTVTESHGVYSQLSGHPLGEMKPLSVVPIDAPIRIATERTTLKETIRAPNEITFVRNRMLYARAALNGSRRVRFGLRHIHVLNRFPCRKGTSPTVHDGEPAPVLSQTTVHVMLYIFPRQFGLHNVFTSEVDSRQTVQPFQDYTIREEEISSTFVETPKLPRRLRGRAVELVTKLQLHHARCSYKKLLDYYCPIDLDPSETIPMPLSNQSSGSTKYKTQFTPRSGSGLSIPKLLTPSNEQPVLSSKPSLMDHATPTTAVAAFCVAVLHQLIPHQFWGSGEDQQHNLRVFTKNIKKFVLLRRFESLTLHEAMQDIKIGNITWLGPAMKMCKSDMNKRLELFHEFLYYVFDSILIPLIRSNFHVTESNVHRYRLFYFRHDVWKSLAEPALTTLKLSMFEELPLQKASRLLDARKLGFSYIRLLPKTKGIRPIMNLRRRVIKKGTTYLGVSINSVLTPVHNILTYEKTSHPHRLGASLFSIGDLYSRLKAFQARLDTTQQLYFVKLDVQSAFDTIPQAAVIDVMRALASEDEYRISKHVEVKPGEDFRVLSTSKPRKKWTAIAHASDDMDTLDEALEEGLAKERRNTVFVENIVSKFHGSDEIFGLLEEHVKNNIVQIGKKFFRQKLGIPQGSVISSHLCNYFYADLEQKHLAFLKPNESLLLRLIDDFLLITTNAPHAKRFLQVMHDGVPEYGVQVNPDKTLVNFEVTINGKKVARVVGAKHFPYCGSFIDTKTLEIRKDRERKKEMALSNALTVEYSKNPGHVFHRKVLNAFKIQAHAMFLDTSLNSMTTVLFNIYTAFLETANKTWTYAKCLPVGKQPSTALMIKTIKSLSDLAFVLSKSKARNGKNVGYKCAVSKVQMEWLVLNAFKRVLNKRQSKYVNVLQWLDEQIGRMKQRESRMCERLRGVLTAKEFEDE